MWPNFKQSADLLEEPPSPASDFYPLAPDKRYPATRQSIPAYRLRCATSSMTGVMDYTSSSSTTAFDTASRTAHIAPQRAATNTCSCWCASRSWTKQSATSSSNPTGTSTAAALSGFCRRSLSHDPAAPVHLMPPRAGLPALEEGCDWKTNWFDKMDTIAKCIVRTLHSGHGLDG